MRARYAFEYEAIERLQAQGYHCVRSAGSRGTIDVLAMSPDCIKMIQVKSTKRPYAPQTVRWLMDAVEELQTLPRCPSTEPWLWLKVLHGPWLEWSVRDWPVVRSELRDQIRREIQEGLS